MRWFAAAPATRTDTRELPGVMGFGTAGRLFLRFASPRILTASLAVWVAARASLGGYDVRDALIVIGIAAWWPFQEWFAHAFVLHLRPRTLGPFRIDPLFARVHRWHHRHPTVIERVFLPGPIIAAFTPVNALLWWLCTPDLPRAATGAAAFTAAALTYEWMHYIAHVPVAPRSRWLVAVRRHHALHHHRNEHYWHAFTVPWIDAWLGTGPHDPREVPQSATAHDLGVAEVPE